MITLITDVRRVGMMIQEIAVAKVGVILCSQLL